MATLLIASSSSFSSSSSPPSFVLSFLHRHHQLLFLIFPDPLIQSLSFFYHGRYGIRYKRSPPKVSLSLSFSLVLSQVIAGLAKRKETSAIPQVYSQENEIKPKKMMRTWHINQLQKPCI